MSANLLSFSSRKKEDYQAAAARFFEEYELTMRRWDGHFEMLDISKDKIAIFDYFYLLRSCIIFKFFGR